MGKQKSLKLNFLMNAILTMSTVIFPLITAPYASRILLPEGTGKVAFALSAVTYFGMFSQLGIPTYGIRACAKVRDDREELSRTVQEIFIINMVMTLAVYAVFFISLAGIQKFRDEKALMLIMGITIFLNAIGMEWLYKALEQYTYIALRSIAFKFIALIALFALVHSKSDYVIYGGITIFAGSASNILNFLHLHRYISLKPVKGYCFKRHIKAVLVFFAMSCATTVYTNLDNVMLGFMATDTDVGYYYAAVKIKHILVIMVTSLGEVLLPRASYYIESGMKDEFYRITRKAVNFVFFAAAPAMVYFMLYAREGIYFLFGRAFEGSVLPMRIIMPALLFIGLTNVMGIQMLVPMGREKAVLKSEAAGAVTDLVLNLILIPRFASAGAAIGTLAAEIVVFIVQFAALKGEVAGAYKEAHYLSITAGIVLGSLISYRLAGLGLGVFITLCITAASFFGAYGLVLVIFREPMAMEVLDMVLKFLHIKRTDNVFMDIYNFCAEIYSKIRGGLFLICFGVYYAGLIMLNTLFIGYPGVSLVLGITRKAVYAAAAGMFLFNVVFRQYSIKELAVFFAAAILLGINMLRIHNITLLFLWLLMFDAKGVDFEKIIKLSFAICTLLLLAALICSQNGILEDRIFIRKGDTTERHGFGFFYTTNIANYFMHITFMFLYLSRKKGIVETLYQAVLLMGLNYLIYLFTDTKSAFLLGFLALLASILLKPRFLHGFFAWAAGLAAVLFSLAAPVFCLAMHYFYTEGNEYAARLNKLVGTRLMLAANAIEEYGFTWFGQEITWVGNGTKYVNPDLTYNYVDSSYIQYMLNYGTVFVLLVTILYLAMGIRALRLRSTALLVVLILIMAHSLFDPQLMWLDYNPFLLFIFAAAVYEGRSGKKDLEGNSTACRFMTRGL